MRVNINPEGRAIITQYIFPVEDLVIGTRWASTGNTLVTIESIGGEWVTYSWFEGDSKKTHEKSAFAFQCRYCLVLE